MRVIIAGCRDITGPRAENLVWDAIEESGWYGEITEVFHGRARGIDAAAQTMCQEIWPVTSFPAEWEKHGRAAGPLRNMTMASKAHALIAIWDGKSRGTKNMIETAQRCGLRVYIKRVDIRPESAPGAPAPGDKEPGARP